MAAAEVMLPVQYNLESIVQEIAKNYSKEDLKKDIEFTKGVLGGKFLKLPDDDIVSCLEELKTQGRITPEKPDLLEYYAKDNKSIQEKIYNFKKQGMKEREKERESEFVGREEDVKALLDHLTSRKTSVVTLYGDPGVGKTTLADKVAEHLEGHGQVVSKKKVDLRKMKTQMVVCHAVLQAFKSPKFLQPCMEFVYEAVENLEKRIILTFDNGEELLNQLPSQESKFSFCDFLKGMVEHDKSEKLTILLTSRVPLPGDANGNINYHVQPLKDDSSATVLEKPNISLSPAEKNEIIEFCKNKPLLLKLISSLMQENLINTQNIKGWKKEPTTLETGEPRTEGEQAKDTDIYNYNIFNKVFEEFMPELKKATIKLSLFQGLFTAKDAVKMTSQPEREAMYYLNTLRDRNFLQERSGERRTKYEMHPAINEFMIAKCKEKAYEDIITDAKEMFFKNYLEKSQKIAQLLEKDYVRAYSVIEKQRLNLKLAIEISFEMGFLYFSSDFSENSIIADLFLILIPGPEREKLFREWSITAEKKGEWICYANLVCMQIQVLLEKTTGKPEARSLLEKVGEVLNNLTDKSSNEYQLAESSYLYAKGEMFYSDCQSKDQHEVDQAEWQEVIKFYQKSLQIREVLLKDHTDTARTLNAIGNCYMSMNEPETALEYYTRALKMRRSLSGEQEHVDMPVYISQIGTTHELLGSKYKKQAMDANLFYRKGLTQKYKKEFREALKNYQEALDLEKKLHISGYMNTATFYRNMSNSYSHLEDYESSLKTAKKALSVRKKFLGIDSDTIRSYYQVGLAYEKLGNFEKSLKYFYKSYIMERALPPGERSAVRDRVVNKIDCNLGSTKEAEEWDKRHKEALQKGSLDDEILTSEEEDEEEKEDKHSSIQLPSSDESSSEVEEDDEETAVKVPPGASIQKKTYQIPPGANVQTTDQVPPGANIQTTDQVPPGANVQTTDQVPPGASQEEEELDDKDMDIDIEENEVVDSHTIGGSVITWEIKETGVHILFLPGTVPSDINISCHVYIKPDNHLPLELAESLVSRVVKVEADNYEFEKEFGLLIPHSGVSQTKGYEVVVKEFQKHSGIWEDVDDFINIQQISDLQNVDSEFTTQLKDINVPAILLPRQKKKSCMVCVTCRLVKETLLARPGGSKLMSSVFPEVQLLFEKNTVKKNTPISMKVHPLPNFTVFNSHNISCGPVLYLQSNKSDDIDVHKPVQIDLPHPLAWYDEYDDVKTVHGQVRVLYNKHSDSSCIEWQDITDNQGTNLSVNGHKICLKVQHFSMYWLVWVSDVKQDIQKLLNKAKEKFAILCLSSPFMVAFSVKCEPRIRKGQAIVQYTAIPKHLTSKRNKFFDDSDEELYDKEEIQVELTGPIQRYIDEKNIDSPFCITFSSKVRKGKSMHVVVEEEDGMFSSQFLRVLTNNKLICDVPFNLPIVDEDKELKPLEFYGVPLDPEDKWKLLETPKDVLRDILNSSKSLHNAAKKAYEITCEEESLRFFYQSVSHTDLQKEAFDAIISNLTDASMHVKSVLEAGKKVVEQPFDRKTAKYLSQYIKEDYIKLAQATDLSKKCAIVKEMKGKSEDRCCFFLYTWIKHKEPTLHQLMQKLREAGCEKGMKALLEHFEDCLEKTLLLHPEESPLASHSTVVTHEIRYEEAATVEPLLASPHISDLDQTSPRPSNGSELSPAVVETEDQGSFGGAVDEAVSPDVDHPAGHLIESNISVTSSDLDESAVGDAGTSDSTGGDDDSSISAGTTGDGETIGSDGDSPDSESGTEHADSGSSLLYPGLCLIGLSLCFIYFRYARR